MMKIRIIEIRDKGEYKIRPYKGFRGLCRGEPCVHPTFADSLLDEIYPCKSVFIRG